jgi:hypothetical protein
MRLDKLARQLQAHQRQTARQADGAQRQLRDEIAELDDRIGRLIEALERGMEPDLIGARLAKLRDAKEKAEIDLRALTPVAVDSTAPDPEELLSRLPDLSRALRKAPPELKRQVFDAFGLQITYDKIGRRSEISATITDGDRASPREREEPPEGGSQRLPRRSEGHSGGGIRTRDLRVMSLHIPQFAGTADRLFAGLSSSQVASALLKLEPHLEPRVRRPWSDASTSISPSTTLAALASCPPSLRL